MFERYSKEWKVLVARILEEIVCNKSFRNKVVKDFAQNKWCTSDTENKIMRSLATAIAVYGDFASEAQEKLAFKILGRHTPRLFEEYSESFGVITKNEDDEPEYSTPDSRSESLDESEVNDEDAELLAALRDE